MAFFQQHGLVLGILDCFTLVQGGAIAAGGEGAQSVMLCRRTTQYSKTEPGSLIDADGQHRGDPARAFHSLVRKLDVVGEGEHCSSCRSTGGEEHCRSPPIQGLRPAM